MNQTGRDLTIDPARALKIDIVVHGRFHGFALARALLAQGHDVLVHTNYPGRVVERFGVPRENVRSFLLHGLASRTVQKLSRGFSDDAKDRWLHTTFGRWAAQSVRRDSDFVHGFSGVMEEFLDTPRTVPHQVRTIVRGSAHIREQARLLLEEQQRVGVALDRPSDWMIEREEREYALADKIFVLSSFARDSFLAHGCSPNRLWLTPLGVDMHQFGIARDVLAARTRRMDSGGRLRVLTVGTLSFRKGAWDLIEVATRLSGRMDFRFVGDQPAELREKLQTAREHIEVLERVPEPDLVDHYAWADIFLFPTIEDGFAAVLLQAAAAGLPILATTNCSAPDIVAEGRTGWIVRIRDADSIAQRLMWCDMNRAQLVGVATTASHKRPARSWDAMASQMMSLWFNEGVGKSAFQE